MVLGEAVYAALKVCHQVHYCLEADSKAAIHGDDIIAEGELEKLNRLDEVLKRLVVVRVLHRIGPGAVEHEAHREHRRTGIREAGRSETPCCDHQKPFQGGREAAKLPGSKDLGRAGRGGGESESARYRHQHFRVQWAIRHTVLCEKTERDDDEATEAGQTSDWPGWRDISLARRSLRSDSIIRSMATS